MLERLTRSLQGSPAERQGALLQVFHLAFLALAVPGLVLGGIYALTRPATYPPDAVLGLAVVGLLIGIAAVYMAKNSARDPRLKPQQAALTAAMQLASAPAVPFLLGCTALNQLLALGVLWGLALLLYGYARGQVLQLGKLATKQAKEP